MIHNAPLRLRDSSNKPQGTTHEMGAVSTGTKIRVQFTCPVPRDSVDMKHEEEVGTVLWKRYYDVQELL